MKIVIFILCYDDRSEQIARSQFDTLPWARVVRITTTIYLENIMYSQVLAEEEEVWRDADYVGTLSYRAAEKVSIPDFDAMQSELRLKDPDVVSFFSHRMPITYEATCHPHFVTIWRQWMSQLGLNTEDNTTCAILCNYWMAKPAWMQKYIQFFRRAQAVLDGYAPIQAQLWSDADYPNRNHEFCMRVFGRTYYTHHPFLCERLPAMFFASEGAKLLRTGRVF